MSVNFFTSQYRHDINTIRFSCQVNINVIFGVMNINISNYFREETKTSNLPFLRATISVLSPYLLDLFKTNPLY